MQGTAFRSRIFEKHLPEDLERTSSTQSRCGAHPERLVRLAVASNGVKHSSRSWQDCFQTADQEASVLVIPALGLPASDGRDLLTRIRQRQDDLDSSRFRAEVTMPARSPLQLGVDDYRPNRSAWTVSWRACERPCTTRGGARRALIPQRLGCRPGAKVPHSSGRATRRPSVRPRHSEPARNPLSAA
jgi:hypothetical protein